MQSHAPDSKQRRLVTSDEQPQQPKQAGNNAGHSDVYSNTTTDNIDIVMNNGNANPDNLMSDNNNNNHNNKRIIRSSPNFFVKVSAECDEMQEDQSRSNCSSTSSDPLHSTLSGEATSNSITLPTPDSSIDMNSISSDNPVQDGSDLRDSDLRDPDPQAGLDESVTPGSETSEISTSGTLKSEMLPV